MGATGWLEPSVLCFLRDTRNSVLCVEGEWRIEWTVCAPLNILYARARAPLPQGSEEERRQEWKWRQGMRSRQRLHAKPREVGQIIRCRKIFSFIP